MLYSRLCNKYSDKSNLSVASSAVGDFVDRSSLRGVNNFFYNFTVVHTKMGHVNKTTPLLGVFCHPFGKTRYSLPSYKMCEIYL